MTPFLPRLALSLPPRRVLRGLGVAAACLLAAACAGSKATPTFDLTAQKDFGRGGGRSGVLLVVAEPTALQVLDSDRIAVRRADGGIAFVADAQWADRLPKLVQARLVQSFENAGRLKGIGRPGDRLSADQQLLVDLRGFGFNPAVGAEVELSAKLVGDRSGKILAARVFSVRVPVEGDGAAAVAAGLDKAFAQVTVELVGWASGRR